MDNLISYGQVERRVGVQCVGRILGINYATRHLDKFGIATTAKKNMGDTIKWRRYFSFPVSAAEAPLTEAIPPSAIPLTWQDYSAVLQEYGAVSELTQKAKDLHEDDLFRQAIEKHGELMSEVLETITWKTLVGGCTNKFYANGATGRTDVDDAISHSDVGLVVRAFGRVNAKPIRNMVGPTDKVSTRGIMPGYLAFSHPDLKDDLKAAKGFVPFVEYGSPDNKYEGEYGAIGEVRFCFSSLYRPLAASGASTADMLSNGGNPGGAAACDIYQILILAREAYGIVRLAGEESVGLKIIQPDQLDSGNRLGQKGSVGWLVRYAVAILDMQRLAVLEVACRHTPQ
jgi:N4-gp56 family major capsid protein